MATPAGDSMSYQSVAEEIEGLRRNFSTVKIQSATSDFVTLSYQRSENPRSLVKVTLTFPQDYPSHALIPDVQSVPPGLKKRLEKDLVKLIEEQHLAGTHQQVEAVVGRLTNFVDTNLFVPCWKEIHQVLNLVKNEEGCTIQQNASKGLLQLKFACAKYFYSCSIIINRAYPTTVTHAEWGQACKLTVKSTNFPSKIETILTLQAKELVKRMQDGMKSEDALRMSNPIQAPASMQDQNTPREVQLSQNTLKGLKHDIETLAQVRDLRSVDASTRKGNANLKVHSAKERKDARRAVAKITKQELSHDIQEEQWKQEEQERLAGYNIDEYDGSNPQPSLLSLVTFLSNKIHRLPEEKCPICQELTLPNNPDELQALYLKPDSLKTDKEKKARRQARLKRPVRTYCGCWYHYSCLDKFMREPPFGAACPTENCGRRVYHPDWPADIKELERAWANKQARQREIEDAAMFL